jgi:1-acyl-sn-glycerol-3-phosphate acyltransferase
MTSAEATDDKQSDLRQPLPWWYVLLEGLFSFVIGIMLMRTPGHTLNLIVRVLGYYWIAVGLLSLVTILTKGGRGRRTSLATRGVLGVLAGLFALFLDQLGPDFWTTTLMFGVGFVGVIIGVVGLIQAFKGGGWGAAIMGLLGVVFGLSIWGGAIGILANIFWTLGLFTAIGGVASMLLALRLRNHPEEASLGANGIRNPTMGVIRLLALVTLLFIAIVIAFISWIIPAHYKDVPLQYWVITFFSRVVNWVLGVKVVCADEEKLRAHEGLVLANHVSYLDITTLIAVAPMRFLSTAEVFKIPFVGWVADAISTVFVDRSDRSSRHSVRDSIANSVAKRPYPPFVVFPEGHFGTPTQLSPFHYGMFAVAIENQFPYMPVALRYDRSDVATWRGVKEEKFAAALWRMLTHRGTVSAELFPLDVVHPAPDDDAAELARETQRAIENALGLEPAPTTLKEPEPTAADTDEA